MKKLFYFLGMAVVLLATGCKKEKDGGKSVSCNLPSTPVPVEMTGNWANGYNSSKMVS